MTQGIVLAIERCSIQDGPGIRTTVFLKGCPLRCLWCHNPESQAKNPVLYSLHEKCTSCGTCVTACPHVCHTQNEDGSMYIDRTDCRVCGACVKACPNEALEIKGEEMGVEQVMAEVQKDRAYYEESGGGMTVSGGEPLAQWEFTLALLKTAKASGIHTCIETSGFGKREYLMSLARYTDLFYYDVKETDSVKHKEFTGVDNVLILENLKQLDILGKPIVLRCPLIPGLNARDEHLRGIAELAESLNNVKEIHPLAYHPMGIAKRKRSGMEETDEPGMFVSEDQLEAWAEVIRQSTDKPVVTDFEQTGQLY